LLRAITRQQIIEAIEGSYFGSENYALQFGEGESNLAFSVRFLPDSRFNFLVSRVGSSHFQTIESPGDKFIDPETFHFDAFTKATNRLAPWLGKVKEEVLAANPFSKEVLELRAQLDERLASLGEELEGFFSKEEAMELTSRLAVFEERLRTLSEKNADLNQAVQNLSKVIADLNEATNSINRGTWYRMAGGRLLGGMKVLSKSKEAREFALEAAKKFLLEGPK
jgi:tetratricopeptide (TPR) repeat protein